DTVQPRNDLNDVRGVDVDPALDDQVLDPADDVEVSILVQTSQVPGMEPSISKGPRGGLRIPVVTGGRHRARQQQLANFPDRQIATVSIDDPCLDAWPHTTTGAGFADRGGQGNSGMLRQSEEVDRAHTQSG